MNTDIQKLRAALMVYKFMNYSDAAENLNFSHSAISKQVMSIENDLGIKLFIRHGKGGITATPACEKLIPYMQQLVSDFDRMDGVVRTMKTEDKTFILGYKSVFPAALISRIIQAFGKELPDVKIETVHHRDQDLIEMVNLGRADAAVMALQGDISPKNGLPSIIKEKGLVYREIMIAPEVFFLNKNHPLADRPKITFDDVMNDNRNTFAMINPTPGEKTPRLEAFYSECSKRNITRTTAEIPYEMGVSMDILRSMISQNRFIVASVPESSSTCDGIVVKRCDDNPFTAHIIICCRPDNNTASFSSFLKACERLRNKG